MTIVASQPANWERDQGFNVFQNMLQAHPDIDSVFACSDLMALGAIEAIAAAGKTGKIRVIGFDALDDAKKAIAAGTMEASVAQFPSEMGTRRGRERGEGDPRRNGAGGHQGEARTRDQGQREMTSTGKGRLAIGLIGLGRLGRVYARDLASRIAETRLVAVADPVGALAKEVAAEFDVPRALRRSAGADRRSGGRRDRHRQPDAHAPRAGDRGGAAGRSRRSARSRRRCRSTKWRRCRTAIAQSGMFFQMGFMRRFDAGYAVGEEADRGGAHRHAAGVQVDLARSVPARASSTRTRRAAAACCSTWASTTSISRAGSWARCGRCRRSARRSPIPELATVGDIDNAVASLTFASGKLGVVDLSRSGIYGYDISTEILGLGRDAARSATCARRR